MTLNTGRTVEGARRGAAESEVGNQMLIWRDGQTGRADGQRQGGPRARRGCLEIDRRGRDGARYLADKLR
jgi:hypothetical protein